MIKNGKINPPDVSVAMDVGFKWWSVSAWLGITTGNAFIFFQLRSDPEFALLLVSVNSVLMLMILSFNKYAFLVATVASLNPIIWIINGIYLKNRWSHPKVNSSEAIASAKTRAERLGRVSSKSQGKDFSVEEEELAYERAAQELESDEVKRGLWAKSFADADGVEAAAKARYIKARSEQLIIEMKRKSEAEKNDSIVLGGQVTPLEKFPENTAKAHQRAMDELIKKMHEAKK